MNRRWRRHRRHSGEWTLDSPGAVKHALDDDRAEQAWPVRRATINLHRVDRWLGNYSTTLLRWHHGQRLPRSYSIFTLSRVRPQCSISPMFLRKAVEARNQAGRSESVDEVFGCPAYLTSARLDFIRAWIDEVKVERTAVSVAGHSESRHHQKVRVGLHKRGCSQPCQTSENKMVTPPSSTDDQQYPARIATSPPKNAEDVEESEPEDTPRPFKRPRVLGLAGGLQNHAESRPLVISPHHPTQPPSIYSQSSVSGHSSPAASRSQSRSKRRSPVKKHQLRWLSDKPVDYRSYTEARGLPQFEEGHELAILNAELAHIYARNNAFLPRQLQVRIKMWTVPICQTAR